MNDTSSSLRIWERFLGALALLLILAMTLAASLPMLGSGLFVTQAFFLAGLMGVYYWDGRYKGVRKRPVGRIAISIFTVSLTIRYFMWRATSTLPFGYGWFDVALGITLLVAEGHGMVSSVLGQLINVMPIERKPLPLPEDVAALPKVDIVVPTYNEDVDIVATTIIAATQISYPADRYRVWILDDGGTDEKCAQPGEAGAAARRRGAELCDIAERFGASYLTRAKNEHAKAGNLNAALKHLSGDLILVLDCDHVPTEDFLKRTVGFFISDPKLFLLQTPHNFVNNNPVERNLSIFMHMPAEHELFYLVMQPGLDFWGAAFFCGSAAIVRRAAIDEIGGFSGRTITEDAETTVAALGRGWRTAYYDRPMVSGLQPETFTGFIQQRVRWAQGMMQIFILENVWLKPGLTFMQRVFFTNFAFYWLFPFARIVLLVMPPAFLLFGANVAITTSVDLLTYAMPYYFATLINSQYFYGRVRWPFFSQVYETAQAFLLSAGVYSAIRSPTKPTFKVTPKGEVLEADFVSSLIGPFYFLALLSLVSIVFGAWRLLTQPELRASLLLVGGWVFLDALTVMNVIGALAERRQIRTNPRVPRRELVWVRINTGSWHMTKTIDLSRYGASFSAPPSLGAVKPGDPVELFFRRHGMSLLGRVLNVYGAPGQLRIGVRYELESVANDRFAVRLAFGDSSTIVGGGWRRHTGLAALPALGFLVKTGLRNFVRYSRLVIYSAHAEIRKSLGEMMRKLSVTSL
jgi:cellulose synthase (UDP-forming)